MQTLRAIEARETSGMWGPSECQIWREVDEGWLTRRRTGPCALLPAVEPLLVVVVVVHGRVRKKRKKGFLFFGSRHARRPINLTIFHSLCSGYPPGHWEWISAVVDVAVNGRLTSRPLQKSHPFSDSLQETVWGAMAVTQF